MQTVLLLFGGLLLLSAALPAQQRSLLRVLGADQLQVSTVGEMEYRELIGNVRMQQDNVFIDCDRAVQNLSQNSVELRGNVVIRQDTLELRTERGFYDGDTRIASSRSGVYLNDGHVTLTAKVGTYATNTKVADFLNDVTIDDTAATITARRMRYVRDSALIIAHDSVRIRFKDENVLILSDSVRHYPDLQRSEFYRNPLLWQIDTAYVHYDDELMEIDSLDLDTLHIAADFMLALRDSSNTFRTEGDVRLVREDLSACSATALFQRSDSVIHLQGDPVLWHGENQITGDSITAFLADNKLRQLDVIGDAFSISRSKPTEQDTLYPPGRFDQTSGKRIRMSFADGEPQRIRVEETAVSLYYLYDEGALNGVRRESSDLILIDFEEGKVSTIRSIRGVEGTYFPEKYVTGVESTYNLDGFEWRDDRPMMRPIP
jgi:lipopolysaccharide export system protein LptA